MKKLISAMLCLAMCLSLFVGCSSAPEESPNSDTSSAALSSESSSVSEGTSSNTGDAINSVYPAAEIEIIDDPEEGIYNLSVQIQPDGDTLEEAFSEYTQAIRQITLSSSCQNAFNDQEFSKVLFKYEPQNSMTELPKSEIFSLALEPTDNVYRLIPDSIGEEYTEYVSFIASWSELNPTVFLSDDDSQTMLDCFADAKLTDLYDESYILQNLK